MLPKYVIKPVEEERIKTGQSWLFSGKLRIASNCITSINNMRDAVHDPAIYERTGEIRTKETYNDEGHLDALDCIHYLIAETIRKL